MRKLKFVANPGFRNDVTRIRRIFLDFLADILYDYANQLGFFPILGPPHYL